MEGNCLDSDPESKRKRETINVKKKGVTFHERHVEFAKWNDENSAGEIRTRREVQRAGMVIEAGEAGSKGDAGDVILDESVHVDDSGGVAELHAGDKHEDQRDY